MSLRFTDYYLQKSRTGFFDPPGTIDLARKREPLRINAKLSQAAAIRGEELKHYP